MLKKLISLGLGLIIMFSFWACVKDDGLTGLGGFEGLDPEIELEIIKTFLGEDFKGQESIDEKRIKHYYGTYNGYVVVNISSGWCFGIGPCLDIIEEVIIIYPYARNIYVYKDNVFYTLQDALNSGFLTINNVEEIGLKNRDFYPELYYDGYEQWVEEQLKNTNSQVGEE